jgi:hypothetical protein
MEEEMARRKKVRRKGEFRRVWSEASLNTGPTIISSPRLGASASLRSVAKDEELPELREKEFGLSEPRVAKTLKYVKIYWEGQEYHRITVFNRYPISRLFLLFRGRQWIWQVDRYTEGIRKRSIVYASREHAYLVLETDNICWKHQEKL